MEKKVLVETSARHVHLTEEDIEVLFGKGATLTHKKDLSQPGQFACEERVTLVGPKKSIANAVSYTHLDVYKRQSSHNAHSWSNIAG